MSTDVDVSAQRRHRYRWFAVLAVLATVAVLVILRVTGGGGSSADAAQPAADLPAAMRQELTNRLSRALELAGTDLHAGHAAGVHPATGAPAATVPGASAPGASAAGTSAPGTSAGPDAAGGHEDHGAGGTLICAVDPFGVDPPGATSLAQVTRVYALHLCALAEPGTPWDWATRYSGPFAATLSIPPVLDIVPSGEGYQQRVHQLIPQRYWARATGPFTDTAQLDLLRRRFNAETKTN